MGGIQNYNIQAHTGRRPERLHRGSAGRGCLRWVRHRTGSLGRTLRSAGSLRFRAKAASEDHQADCQEYCGDQSDSTWTRANSHRKQHSKLNRSQVQLVHLSVRKRDLDGFEHKPRLRYTSA